MKILYLVVLIISDTSEKPSTIYVVNVERNGKIIYTWKVRLSQNAAENNTVCVCMPDSVLVIYMDSSDGQNMTTQLIMTWGLGNGKTSVSTSDKG